MEPEWFHFFDGFNTAIWCILDIKEAVPIFYGKRAKDEEIENIMVDTEIYACVDESCIGWMRKDFVTDDLHCPMCGNEMLPEIRELPKI